MTISTKIPSDAGEAVGDRASLIRDQLRSAIIDRRLGPGTKLSEQEIGGLYSVSRTVAKSALQMLTFEGLVRTERNRGAFVAHPSPEEARQVFASRRLIEPGIVTAACRRFTEADRVSFDEQLRKESTHIAARGPEARRAEIKASGEFHLLLAGVAGNAILLRFMEELVARSSLVIALYGRSGVSTCGHDDHRQIADAVAAGNESRAIELLIRHVAHIEADLDLRESSGSALREALML